jgi:dienelactone hydrolase
VLVLIAVAVAFGVTAASQPARGATGGQAAGRGDAAPAPVSTGSGYAVGITTLPLVDASRTYRLPGGAVVPRALSTYVRYPALGGAGAAEIAGARPAPGSFPLVVFAHGFDVTPAPYAKLLDSWTRAGYVVAAPLFPRTNPHARGGLDEGDVVNQPADVSFVISSLLAGVAPAGWPPGLIDGDEIAVAGQSDGGETALAVADSRRDRDARVRAALVLSGAEMSGIGGYTFPGPALLAVQGTRDVFNEPRYTYAYYRAARAPKYLLRLLGAGHLPPYTTEQPQLAIVERVTVDFLDTYLRGEPQAPAQLALQGGVPGVATLTSDP